VDVKFVGNQDHLRDGPAQGITAFGAEWYVVSASGSKIDTN
jgi:hypothetical protein